jgi:hypothetical protein
MGIIFMGTNKYLTHNIDFYGILRIILYVPTHKGACVWECLNTFRAA